MTLEGFISESQLLDASELDRVKLLAFYYSQTTQLKEFLVSDACEWMLKLDFPQPNASRLLKNIRKSRAFVKGEGENAFRLHATELSSLKKQYSFLIERSETIISTDSILPSSLFSNTRGFIEQLALQVNACYSHSLNDACAVLMRRIIEVCLILSYQNHGIEGQILNTDSSHKSLNDIIGHAKTSTVLNLTKESKACLDTFRVLGNLSAHKIFYNCRRADLERVALEFRALFEELLYKSGIKK